MDLHLDLFFRGRRWTHRQKYKQTVLGPGRIFQVSTNLKGKSTLQTGLLTKQAVYLDNDPNLSTRIHFKRYNIYCLATKINLANMLVNCTVQFFWPEARSSARFAR